MGDYTVAVADRMGSPNKVRIGHLSEKLVSLQDELEHEKQVRSLFTPTVCSPSTTCVCDASRRNLERRSG